MQTIYKLDYHCLSLSAAIVVSDIFWIYKKKKISFFAAYVAAFFRGGCAAVTGIISANTYTPYKHIMYGKRIKCNNNNNNNVFTACVLSAPRMWKIGWWECLTEFTECDVASWRRKHLLVCSFILWGKCEHRTLWKASCGKTNIWNGCVCMVRTTYARRHALLFKMVSCNLIGLGILCERMRMCVCATQISGKDLRKFSHTKTIWRRLSFFVNDVPCACVLWCMTWDLSVFHSRANYDERVQIIIRLIVAYFSELISSKIDAFRCKIHNASKLFAVSHENWYSNGIDSFRGKIHYFPLQSILIVIRGKCN